MRSRYKLILIFFLVLVCFNSLASDEPKVTSQEAKLIEKISEISKDSLPEAIDQLKENLDKNSSAALDFVLGNLYFKNEQLSESGKAYRSALDKMPEFSRAKGNLVQVYLGQEKIDEAINLLKSELILSPKHPQHLSLLGYSYLLKEKPISAESAYRQSLLYDSGDKHASLGLAKSYLMQKRFIEAIALFKELSREFPNDTAIWSNMANAYIETKDYLNAITTLEMANILGLLKNPMKKTLADLYVNENMFDEAFYIYKELIEAKDVHLDFINTFRAVDAFMSANELEKVDYFMKYIDKQIDIQKLESTEENKILKMRARYSFLLGDKEKAKAMYEKLLKNYPLDSDAFLALGQIYQEMGQHEQALFYFERLSRYKGKEFEGLVQSALIHVQLKHYQQAIDLLEEALSIHEDLRVKRYLENLTSFYNQNKFS